ncbi:MAG: hypothetical protein J6M06_03215 [Synergistaceae bacterium]|nr:hypothetical protein [Synergistaceae bacterium]
METAKKEKAFSFLRRAVAMVFGDGMCMTGGWKDSGYRTEGITEFPRVSECAFPDMPYVFCVTRFLPSVGLSVSNLIMEADTLGGHSNFYMNSRKYEFLGATLKHLTRTFVRNTADELRAFLLEFPRIAAYADCKSFLQSSALRDRDELSKVFHLYKAALKCEKAKKTAKATAAWEETVRQTSGNTAFYAGFALDFTYAEGFGLTHASFTEKDVALCCMPRTDTIVHVKGNFDDKALDAWFADKAEGCKDIWKVFRPDALS